jgi:hypothetical protein
MAGTLSVASASVSGLNSTGTVSGALIQGTSFYLTGGTLTINNILYKFPITPLAANQLWKLHPTDANQLVIADDNNSGGVESDPAFTLWFPTGQPQISAAAGYTLSKSTTEAEINRIGNIQSQHYNIISSNIVNGTIGGMDIGALALRSSHTTFGTDTFTIGSMSVVGSILSTGTVFGGLIQGTSFYLTGGTLTINGIVNKFPITPLGANQLWKRHATDANQLVVADDSDSGAAASASTATISSLYFQQDGSFVGAASTVNCTTNLTCSQAGGVLTMSASGSGDSDGNLTNGATQVVNLNNQSLTNIASATFNSGVILSSRPYRYVSISAASMKGSSTNAAGNSLTLSESTETVLGVNVNYMRFPDGAAKYAFFDYSPEPQWYGTTVAFSAVWTSTSGVHLSSVNWCLQGVSLNRDDVINTAYGTAECVSDAMGSSNTVQMSTLSAGVTLGNTWSPWDFTTWRIYRNPADVADTIPSDARLLEVRLLYYLKEY